MEHNIVLIDDDELIVMSLEMIINNMSGFSVIGKGYSGDDAISLYDSLKPDLLLMDIRMNNKNGLDAAREILFKYPDAKILFLTTFLDDEYIIKALNLGVRGYLLKQDYKSLENALTAAINNQSVFGDKIIDKLPKILSSNYNKEASSKNSSFDYSLAGINDKEFAVIQLVADGYSNKEIANKLFLSEGTVRNYLSTILEKLELRDRTQLAIFYLKNI